MIEVVAQSVADEVINEVKEAQTVADEVLDVVDETLRVVDRDEVSDDALD